MKNNTMPSTAKTFEVGFDTQKGSMSVNMIWANTGREEKEAVTETAQRRAEKYGYKVLYIRELYSHEVESNLRRGMPYYSIDEEAEKAHDPSLSADEQPQEQPQENKQHEQKKEEKPMKKYTFAPDSITVNGKTFPAAYEMQEHNIRISATVAENSVIFIDVPETDAYYSEIYALAESMAQAAAYVGETSQDEEEQPEEAPQEQQEEAPAADPEPIQADETPAPIQPEEAPQEQAEEAPQEQQEETPAADPEPIQADETPANHSADETPAADPKQARGVVPEKHFAGESISGNGWSIVFDSGLQRTRVIISDPIREKAVPIIENAGFYYSRPMNSWNKKLTFRAYRAAVALAESLRAALA